MIRNPVFLVACTKTKAAAPCPAKDLYRSDWFRKARAYVEAEAAPWFILSGQHGLLEPDVVIAPYEATLPQMRKPARQAWATRVHHDLAVRRLLPRFGRQIVFLAGATYREFLEPWLAQDDAASAAVAVPMRGLGLGQQLAWLVAHTPEPPPPAPPPAAAAYPVRDSIEPMLAVSTAHVRPSTMAGLSAAGGLSPAPHLVIPHEYGAILYVGEPAPCAGDLAPLLDFARVHGCVWVNLDRDAAYIDGLPTYDWCEGAAA